MSVDTAKKQLNVLMTQDQYSLQIEDNSIFSFSNADNQCIVDIQKTMNVTIKTENKNGKASLTINGLSKDVLKASQEIHKMLKSTREKEEMTEKAERTGVVVEWQYQPQGLAFQSFDLMTNYKLEEALENKQTSVKVSVQGKDYTVAMPKGPATNNQGQTLQIKRIDKLKGI